MPIESEHGVVQKIVCWFFEHYEKPTERLGLLGDGDFIYFGRVVDASKEVHEKFDGLEQERHIERAIKIIKGRWDDLFQVRRPSQSGEEDRYIVKKEWGAWRLEAQLRKFFDREDLLLLLVINEAPVGYAVVALEIPKEAANGSVEDVFDVHAHKFVGNYETLGNAMKAADSFGEAWVKSYKSTRSEQCDCEAIASSASSTPPRGTRRSPSARA